jgi:hypothetical protein
LSGGVVVVAPDEEAPLPLLDPGFVPLLVEPPGVLPLDVPLASSSPHATRTPRTRQPIERSAVRMLECYPSA